MSRFRLNGNAGGVAWWVLAGLLALPGREVCAQGAEYVDSYNALVSNLNYRLRVVDLAQFSFKNGVMGDVVTPVDMDNLRKSVRNLMGGLYALSPEQCSLSVSNPIAAFPFGLRYQSGVMVKPSLMEGIGDGEGRFTKIPARYVTGNTNVYAEVFTDAPLLWVHFEELNQAIKKLRYVTVSRSAVSGVVSLDQHNALSGWASHTDWIEMISRCSTSYALSAPRTEAPNYPMAYSTLQFRDASLERRIAVFKAGGLNTSIPHRVHFFILGIKQPVPEGGITEFASNGDPISEGRWTKWCSAGPTHASNVFSTVFGTFSQPAWGSIPTVGYKSWKGYTSDIRGMLEWDFQDREIPRPKFDDKENDGLLDRGCACKTCLIETEPLWRDMKLGAEILIPLGYSDGTLSGGVRVKAYLTEYETNCRTQQMYSLESKMAWRVNNTGEGWDFMCIKRPSGAEVLFSLKGTDQGDPVDLKRNYKVEEKNGKARMTFPGQKPEVYHEFYVYPAQNGKLYRVGNVVGTNEVYTESTINRGEWPGLTSGFSGPFENNPLISFSDSRLNALLTTNTSGLVREVEYRYKPSGPTNRAVYYHGSKGFRVMDQQGAVISDIRLVVDPVGGGQEIWTGIATNNGLRVARKEKRRQWVDTERNLTMVEQTDVIHDEQSDAASNVTLRAIRSFAWGDELVEETVGAGTPEAQCVRYEYYEDSADTNNYSHLKGVVEAGGGWTGFVYDSRGRECLVRRGLKSAPVGDIQACHETEYGYAGDEALAALHFPAADQVATDDRPRMTVEREQGREFSRTYTSYQGDREVTVRCVTTGALYDDPSNMMSFRTFVTDGLFKGRPARGVNEDGSLRVYDYAYDSGRKELETTEDTGTGVGDVVTNGTRRVTVVDAVGRTIRESAFDIATGIEVYGRWFALDGVGRATVTSNTVDGSVSQSEYGCCGPVRVRDEGGVEHSYTHDELKRVYAVERLGVTTFNTYDVFGNVAATRQCVTGMADIVESSTYDSAGRLVRQVDARGAVVTTAYGTNEVGESVVTTTQPDGSVVVQTSFLDGRTKNVTGTAVRAVSYDYGADERGRYTIEYRGPDTNAALWVKTWQDMLGRTRWVEYADGYTQETLYDGAGRVTGTRDGFVTPLTGYNGKGEAYRSAVDMDGDEVITVAGRDRVSEIENGIGIMEGKHARWSRRYVYAEDGSAERTLDGESWQSLDGKMTWAISHGRTNKTQVVCDVARATREEVTTYPDGTRMENSSTNGLLKRVQRWSAPGELVSRVTYEHDALGRVEASETTGPNGVTIRMEYQFDAGGNVTNTTTRAGGVVRSASFLYDGMGRRVQATLADGGVVRYDYEPTGELAAQAGAQTYPVQYEYDSLGRMAALSTFREGEGGTPDVTRWLYDDRRGWVSAKVYADGTTNRYEYRQDGRLARRVSARGIETRYGYDAGGVVTNTGYSDGTPGVSVGLDRLGRAVEVGDVLGVRSLRYDATGALVEEMLPGEVGKLEYAQDAIGRRTNMVAGSYGVGYRYDAAGRLAGVSSSGMRATYEYANDGVSVATVRLTGNDEEVLRGVREYDEVGALKRISWVAGTNEVTGREYEVNAVGQRVRCAMGDGTYWMYEYDEAGQLKTARKCTADGQQVPGCNHAYTYDGIGNRQSATLNDVEMKYEANGLNQYVSYEKAAEAPKWQGTLFIIGGGGSWKGFGLNGRRCLYDADGNLANDGEWAYAWDAENRLMMASNATTVVRNKYDYMSRRIMKQVYTKAVDVWQLTSDSRFTYDGWSMLSEICHLPSEMRTNVSWFVWGLDLSGTLGGAGGIGGLLYANADPLPGGAGGGFFYAHDGNGNVTALVDTNGSVVVAYEYDPYGKLLSTINHTPLTILENPYTFSTKYRDDETGLSYYGYRFYSAALGRWLNRDPMEEGGGVNLYGFVGNSPVSDFDMLGLYLVAFDGTGNNMLEDTPDSNVERLYRSYTDSKNYYPGVGSRWWSKVMGGYSGLGGEARIYNAWRDLVDHYKNMSDEEISKDPVDIIGFSRGAALARQFANIIYQRGDPRQYRFQIRTSDDRGHWSTVQTENIGGCPLDIRFLGIFDTVASFGQPGNRVDAGYDLSIPPNVLNVRHAIARDESRNFFPLIRIKENTTRIEQMFPGVHSDVGGGYGDNKDIQFGPLLWMWKEGKAVGVPWILPSELKGWSQGAGNLRGHQSNVHFWLDHPSADWVPVGFGDRLQRPDSWEE